MFLKDANNRNPYNNKNGLPRSRNIERSTLKDLGNNQDVLNKIFTYSVHECSLFTNRHGMQLNDMQPIALSKLLFT